MVLVEVGVFRGDYGVLEIRSDLAERNKFVAFAIRCVMNPGLQTALHVHRSCRRVDPPCRYKRQGGKGPKKHCGGDEPSNQESEEADARRGSGMYGQHFSRSFRIRPAGLWLEGGHNGVISVRIEYRVVDKANGRKRSGVVL